MIMEKSVSIFTPCHGVYVGINILYLKKKTMPNHINFAQFRVGQINLLDHFGKKRVLFKSFL